MLPQPVYYALNRLRLEDSTLLKQAEGHGGQLHMLVSGKFLPA